MRLLNVLNGNFECFDTEPNGYAILSHTWGRDEVTFQDMADLRQASQKAGFWKIEMACRIASRAGLVYVWIDTCCIDKSSSAELSEAINSMFQWYKNATVCFAYLWDLPPGYYINELEWRSSSWFTRGWTLQELIAPRRVEFYDSRWNFRGEKGVDPLLGLISKITSVDRDVLLDSSRLSDISLATRMSWAAYRRTTRPEDMAYCLLGIFDVNMPILYGERDKAFLRLQEEIVKRTTDTSLFAWKSHDKQECRGILARSPSEFADFRKMGPNVCRSPFSSEGEIAVTNKGLRLEARVSEWNSGAVFLMDLECVGKSGRLSHRVGILLMESGGAFVRVEPNRTVVSEWRYGKYGSSPQTIYVKRDVDARLNVRSHPVAGMRKAAMSGPFAEVRCRHLHSFASFGEENQEEEEDDDSDEDEFESGHKIKYELGWFGRKGSPNGSKASFPHSFEALSSLNSKEWSRSAFEAAHHPAGHVWQNGTSAVMPKPDLPNSENLLRHVGSGLPLPWLLQEDYEDDTSTDFDALSIQGEPEEESVLSDGHPFLQAKTQILCKAIEMFQMWPDRTAPAAGGSGEQQHDLGPSKSATTASRSRKRARLDDDTGSLQEQEDDEDDDADDNDVGTQKKGSRARGKDRNTRFLACPYYKMHPLRHLNCLKRFELRRIRDVKQHLWRKHRQPYYCPICYETFKQIAERDRHLVARTCEFQESRVFEGISNEQREKLGERVDKTRSLEHQWFEVWDIVFPGVARPASPFVGNDVAEVVIMLREFWNAQGQQIVGSVLRERGLLDWQLAQEERDLQAMHTLILNEMIDRHLPGAMDTFLTRFEQASTAIISPPNTHPTPSDMTTTATATATPAPSTPERSHSISNVSTASSEWTAIAIAQEAVNVADRARRGPDNPVAGFADFSESRRSSSPSFLKQNGSAAK